jgi:antitoxin ParD1/3/4
MTVRKSISFTDPHDDWLKSQISSGKYTSDSEVVRDLIRQQQEREDKFYALKAAIQDGIDSGISDKQVPDIMREVEARLRADGKL